MSTPPFPSFRSRATPGPPEERLLRRVDVGPRALVLCKEQVRSLERQEGLSPTRTREEVGGGGRKQGPLRQSYRARVKAVSFVKVVPHTIPL